MNKRELNPARALYYALFSKLFVFTESGDRYDGVEQILDILIDNPLDTNSGEALKEMRDFIKHNGYEALIQEYDAIFHDPLTDTVRTTASIYCDGVESGRKTVEVKNFLAKTRIRRNEAKFKEPEDSVGFLVTFMYELVELIIMEENAYESLQYCLFEEVINEFIDEFIENIYEHPSAEFYQSVAVVFSAFISFERLYFNVNRPKLIEKTEPKSEESCEFISDAEAKRRAENRIKKTAESLILSCSLENDDVKDDEIEN